MPSIGEKCILNGQGIGSTNPSEAQGTCCTVEVEARIQDVKEAPKPNKLITLRGRKSVAMKPPFSVAATLSWRLETLNRPDQRGVSRFSGVPNGI